MYPTFASPATALTIASIMNDEAVAAAERRHHASLARDTRHARTRRSAGGHHHVVRVRVLSGAVALVAGATLGFAATTAGWTPAGQDDAGKQGPTSKFHGPDPTITVEAAKLGVGLNYP